MNEIAQITTQPFTLQMKGSLRWGKGSALERLEHVLVRVESAAGHVGVGEAPVRPTIYGETVASVEAMVRDHFAPGLLGVDLKDEASIAKVLHSVANNHTARGALDIALCEARAVSEETTLLEAWRGPQERIRVSYILGLASVSETVAEARSVFEQGVRVFKVKIGRDTAHDEQVLQALTAEFGGDALLYADANEGLEPATAARTLERLAALGVAWVEEPLPVEHLRERAALKAENILPIIADDSCFSLRDLRRELDFDTFDILNLKTARTGFTEAAQMLELARTAAKGVMVGSQASSGLGTLHAALFASREGVTHPSELSFPLKLRQDVLTGPLRFADGFLEFNGLRDYRLNERFLAEKG